MTAVTVPLLAPAGPEAKPVVPEAYLEERVLDRRVTALVAGDGVALFGRLRSAPTVQVCKLLGAGHPTTGSIRSRFERLRIDTPKQREPDGRPVRKRVRLLSISEPTEKSR